MLLILLKSSTCLAIFMIFYKLCLEKTSAHTFKRFYLISAVLVAICIPFITFTEYIEVAPSSLISSSELLTYSSNNLTEIIQTKDYLPTILWSIYISGVILLSFRFFKNLHQLIQKIKANPRFKNQNFINVLLQDLVTPHTFFNYIFLNKTKYEHNEIPNEVLLHEQSHAKQKHALDILFIELLQIVFWFNPLLYLIKKYIKLNHEFLADQAVINKGINTKTYQQILLTFSSNVSHPSLANAINYSLIKKRFTVMKTKTSKTALWLKSLIILPLLAIVIYSFSENTIIEKEISKTYLPQQKNVIQNNITEANIEKYKAIIANYSKNLKIYLKGTQTDNSELKILKIQADKLYNKFTKEALKSYNILPAPPVPAQYQEKATEKQIAEYNTWARNLNTKKIGSRIVKQKNYEYYFNIYSIMSKEQKKNAEAFPALPPPPKPVAIKVIEVKTPKTPKVPKIIEVKAPKTLKVPKIIEVKAPKTTKEPKLIEVKPKTGNE